jgi:hypothetical protein
MNKARILAYIESLTAFPWAFEHSDKRIFREHCEMRMGELGLEREAIDKDGAIWNSVAPPAWHIYTTDLPKLTANEAEQQ